MKAAMVVLLAAIAAPANAGGGPASKFWTRERIAQFGVGAAMMAVDVLTTERALKVPGAREAGPVARSPGSLVALKVAGFGASIGISYALDRTGHHRAAKLVPAIIGIPSAVAAIHNLRVK